MKQSIYLVIRTLIRNKLNSIIKVAGISISLTAFLLLIVFVRYECSYDSHISDHENTFRVIRNWQDEETFGPTTPSSLLNEMTDAFAEIESGTRIEHLRNRTAIIGNKVFYEPFMLAVDTGFFATFNLNLKYGNSIKALNQPQQVILSTQKAFQYFGSENPVGKTIEFEGHPFTGKKRFFTVTGVFEDYPPNSHFRPELLLSLKSLEIYNRKENHNHSLATYVKLKKGIDKTDLELKFPPFIKMFYGEEYYKHARSTYLLQPISQIHLNKWVYPHGYQTSMGNEGMLSLFVVLGILILLVATINVINLTVAESIKRHKNFAINQLSGAGKGFVLKSYLYESLSYLIISILLCVILLSLILPLFNQIMEREIPISHFLQLPVIFSLLGVVVIIAVLSTSFPFVSIAKRNLLMLLKNKTGKTKNHGFQSISQTTQLAICIFLFVGSIVVYKQIQFINAKTQSTLNTENVLILQNARYLNESRAAFKQETLKIPEVGAVSYCNSVPGTGYFSNWGFPLDSAAKKINVSVFECDEDYLKVLGIELAQGRFLSKDFGTNEHSVILNEEAVKQLGWQESPIGKRYRIGKDLNVIGVVKDNHFESLQYQITPQAFIQNWSNISANQILVKIDTKNAANAIKQVETTWKKFVPNREMQFSFLNQAYEQWYTSERRTSTLAIILTIMAIFLSGLGLLANIIFQTQNRIKEIGIRKVNGAKISEILAMLNKYFIRWVAIAFVIACPIAWYAMNKWLENFAYKTTLSWWIFALAGVMAMCIALLTVSWQSWRAATRNPVEALRYE